MPAVVVPRKVLSPCLVTAECVVTNRKGIAVSVYRKSFTTMVDLDEFKATTWVLLKNVKMRWEYDGLAYLFREAGIPLYGNPLGSMKENHPYLSVLVPKRRNENYGINIYVPERDIKRARALISNESRVRAAAEEEQRVGAEAHAEFNAKALESKRERDERRKEKRAEKLARIFPRQKRDERNDA